MFRFSRLHLCSAAAVAPPSASTVSGKWSETTMSFGSGVPAPAAPGSNPYSMAELRVPTSALRIKNRLTLDAKTRSKKRQPVQLQPGPKLTPPTVPSKLVSLESSIDSTKGDLEKAQNGIARLWNQQQQQQKQEKKTTTVTTTEVENNSNNKSDDDETTILATMMAKKKRIEENIRHQQSLLDTDSFSPEDGVNNFIHKSLNCQATFSGIVVDISYNSNSNNNHDDGDGENSSSSSETQQQQQQQNRSFPSSVTIFVKEDDNTGILLNVILQSSSSSSNSSNHQQQQIMMMKNQKIEKGSNIVVTGSLRMKRIVYDGRKNDESDEEENKNSNNEQRLPSHFTIPVLRRTKPIIVLPSASASTSSTTDIEEMLSKVQII